MKTPMLAAAIQMAGKLCDIPYNIAQAGELTEKALRTGARIVALPEFFTTPIIYDERLYSCALKPENPALDMMQQLSKQYGAIIGGSYLELRNGDVFNTYVLAEPDGMTHKHDKDQPTMVENSFYKGGADDGRCDTSFGRAGIALCWETIRSRTVCRLTERVDFLLTGSHWWSEPDWSLGRSVWAWLHRYNSELMARTPGLFARLIGAPNLHAAHCGELEGQFQLTERKSVRMRTRLLGETQITDANGTVLARRMAKDGPGVISANIFIGATDAPKPVPNRFWIDPLPLLFRVIWHHQNAIGRSSYRSAKSSGRLSTYDFTRNELL